MKMIEIILNERDLWEVKTNTFCNNHDFRGKQFSLLLFIFVEKEKTPEMGVGGPVAGSSRFHLLSIFPLMPLFL